MLSLQDEPMVGLCGKPRRESIVVNTFTLRNPAGGLNEMEIFKRGRFFGWAGLEVKLPLAGFPLAVPK
jgi:hypothetical protein